MKSFLRSVSFAMATTLIAQTAFCAAPGAPKPAAVLAGTFTLTLDSSFTGSLSNQGIATTYIANEVSSTTSPQFQISAGLVDLNTGSSEVTSIGGIGFTSNNEAVRLERLTLESDQTSNAHVTALVIVNGQFMGRHNVFTVTSGPGFTFPLNFGQQSSQPISFKIAPQFAKEVADYFQVSPDTYKGMVGQFSLNLILTHQ